jgi:hypothetical protein
MLESDVELRITQYARNQTTMVVFGSAKIARNQFTG